MERNGKFHVRVYRKEGAVCKSFHLKKDALVWARQTEADIQAGRWKSSKVSNSPSLQAALERYRDEISISKKGAAQETCIINAIAREKGAQRDILSITAAEIAAMRDAWLKTLAPATVRRRLAILSHCFEISRKEWAIDVANPVSLIRKPVVSNARSRRLHTGELDAVLEASESSGLVPVARLAVETAMRLSEIVGLRWRDISLAQRTATLHDSKNGTGRIVPLSPIAIALLSELPRRLDGQVFGISGASISQAWSRAVERARTTYQQACADDGINPNEGYLSNLHFHDLRHEATSRLFERGVFGAMEVASITGHKTLQMLSRYTHLSAARLADKLAQS
ncbi:site-specific integrase [Herbaspirillum sp. C7C2]|nr:site-specific integrase [Herbaspirillum sp. C7C2]